MKAALDFAGNSVRSVSTMEAHALWAKTYDEAANPLLALEERAIKTLLPDLNGKYVLDLACGTGRWLTQLLRRGTRNGIGVDLSREMLEVGSRKPALDGKLVHADCLALPIRDRSVDFSICSFAASYLFNLPVFADELARVSRPYANVFVSDFHPAGHDRGWKRSFRFGGRIVEIASLGHSIERICEAFENAGFVLMHRAEPHIDEPERRVFARAKRLQLFDSVRGSPAIFILHFQLSGKQENPGEGR